MGYDFASSRPVRLTGSVSRQWLRLRRDPRRGLARRLWGVNPRAESNAINFLHMNPSRNFFSIIFKIANFYQSQMTRHCLHIMVWLDRSHRLVSISLKIIVNLPVLVVEKYGPAK